MPAIPRDKSPDSTLALLRDGYEFIQKRRRRLQSDLFQTRLLFQKTICMSGEEAARVFYDTDRFQRDGAAPIRLKMTLFGRGGVQGLDDETHRARKQMFMSLMSPEGIERLVNLAADQWHASIQRWEAADRVVLFDEVRKLLCRTVHAWAGVPLDEAEVDQRAADIGAMIDGSGAVGPKHWQARLARKRAEGQLGALVKAVRARETQPSEGSALHAVASYRDPDDELLDERVAAVELLNVLRPTVAVTRYVTFAALALYDHPESRQRLRAGEDGYAEHFVQEVRRFYPFFPFVAARTRTDFEWRGYRFPEGVRVLLDLYGTNRDGRRWNEPEAFRPDRFRTWDESAYDLIPQGGGDHFAHHRCPGEWITIALMQGAVRVLTEAMTYDVPEQNLRIDLSEMPALPKSRFVIANVRAMA